MVDAVQEPKSIRVGHEGIRVDEGCVKQPLLEDFVLSECSCFRGELHLDDCISSVCNVLLLSWKSRPRQ